MTSHWLSLVDSFSRGDGLVVLTVETCSCTYKVSIQINEVSFTICLGRVAAHKRIVLALMAYADNLQCVGDSSDMINAPAADRNKGPILDALQQYLSTDKGFVFEIASGPGQHVIHFAEHFPSVTFQPSDCEVKYLKSIQAYIKETGVTNVLAPVHVDITQPFQEWCDQHKLLPQTCDGIININMIHISPWETCKGLMLASGHLLKSGGFLLMYGPFMVDGVISAESNVKFDKMLRSQDASWGLREIADVKKLAEASGLKFEKMIDLPANNKVIVFYKV